MTPTEMPPSPGWLSPSRRTGLVLLSLWLAATGWAFGTALTTLTGADRGVLAPMCALPWLLGCIGWAATGRGSDDPSPLPVVGAGASVLAALGVALLGVALGAGTPLPSAATALLAGVVALAVRRTVRERAADLVRIAAGREHERRIQEEGITARATVTGLSGPGLVDDEGRSWAEVDLRWTDVSGVGRAARIRLSFPAYDPPRRGGTATVRYLPDDPLDVRAELHRDGVPQDARPE
ncbi:hypothetical protein [Kitasatospora terrestris]|uniref:Uncharacterized protein n=1 Tax=Kitasatospora terrestris TaxID=258051 RepID=A0ABP9EAI3_9ACTN